MANIDVDAAKVADERMYEPHTRYITRVAPHIASRSTSRADSLPTRLANPYSERI